MKEIKDRLKDLYLKIHSLDLPICGDENGFMIQTLMSHHYVVKIGEKGKPIHTKLNIYGVDGVFISFGVIEHFYDKKESETILKAIEEIKIIKGNKEVEEDKDILLQISELLIIKP